MFVFFCCLVPVKVSSDLHHVIFYQTEWFLFVQEPKGMTAMCWRQQVHIPCQMFVLPEIFHHLWSETDIELKHTHVPVWRMPLTHSSHINQSNTWRGHTCADTKSASHLFGVAHFSTLTGRNADRCLCVALRLEPRAAGHMESKTRCFQTKSSHGV